MLTKKQLQSKGFIFTTVGNVIVFNNHTASFVMRCKNKFNVFMNMSLGFSDGTEMEITGNGQV